MLNCSFLNVVQLIVQLFDSNLKAMEFVTTTREFPYAADIAVSPEGFLFVVSPKPSLILVHVYKLVSGG